MWNTEKAPAQVGFIIRDKQDILPPSSTSHKDQARCADTVAPDASPDSRGTRSDPIDNLLEKLKEQRRLNWSG